MFWKNKDKSPSLDLKCQAENCDFTCDNYKVLQKHTFKKHRGLELRCQVDGCDFICNDYFTLEKHTSWKHPGAK